MRAKLEKMYIEIHGGDKMVNKDWLAILDDDQIIETIVIAGRLGVVVSRLAPEYRDAMHEVQGMGE